MATGPKPVIITAAISGSLTRREDNPALPITVEEMVESAVACRRAGAAVIHLHARDEQGTPNQDVDVFRRQIEGIRERGCDAILNTSTGAAGGHAEGTEERLAPVALEPEMATLDCGSINFGDERILKGSYGFLRESAERMRDHGVVPEIEVFDSGMIANGIRLIEEGLIEGPGVWQVCIGIRGAAAADLQTVSFMVGRLPAGAVWGMLGVGRHQIAANLVSLAFGGHVRTGLEDNIYYRSGELARSNTQLVERAVRLAEEVGRPVATPEQAREIIGTRNAAPVA